MQYPLLGDISSSGGLPADPWYGGVERGHLAKGGYAAVEGYALSWNVCHAVEGYALSVMMSARSILSNVRQQPFQR